MMIAWAAAGELLTADKLLDCHTLLMRDAMTVTMTSAFEAFDSRCRADVEPVMAGDYVFPNRTDHKMDLAYQ
jgi:hypothetical protein